MLDREGLLGAEWLTVEAVRIDELADSIYVRTLIAYEAQSIPDPEASRNSLAQFVALVACDASGKRLFSDEDAEALGRLPYRIIMPIVEAGQELNGMTREQFKATEKNSGPIQAGSSSSSSPENSDTPTRIDSSEDLQPASSTSG